MPLQRRKASGQVAEHGIAETGLCELDVEHAHLGRVAGVDPATEAGREQLAPEARAEEGLPGAHGSGDGFPLGDEPRVVGIVARAHRTAHHDHCVELAPVGKRLSLIELNRM